MTASTFYRLRFHSDRVFNFYDCRGFHGIGIQRKAAIWIRLEGARTARRPDTTSGAWDRLVQSSASAASEGSSTTTPRIVFSGRNDEA